MNKMLKTIGSILSFVGLPLLLVWFNQIKGYFEGQTLVVVFILLCILLMSGYQIGLLRKFLFPKKPKLMKPFDRPDTYILLRNEWRKIPDWQTRDYLANLLGFQAGEADIEIISSQDFDNLQKGVPLESIFTYSR